MVLADSLGGNAKTLMFVNASPADYNSAESVSSFEFAQRVRKVTNDSQKIVENKQIKDLKKQLQMLKGRRWYNDRTLPSKVIKTRIMLLIY